MKLVVLLMVLLLIPTAGYSFSEVQNFFLEDGVHSLGRGGMSSIGTEPERMNLDDPRSVRIATTAKWLRSDVAYEYQRILKIYDGQWQGTHAASDELEQVVGVPVSLLDDQLKLVVALGYYVKNQEVVAKNSTDNFSFETNQTMQVGRGALYADYRNIVSVAATLSTADYATGTELPFEVRIQPTHNIAMGYRQQSKHISGDINLTIEGKSGLIPLVFNQVRPELYVDVSNRDHSSYLRYGVEPGRSNNMSLEGKLDFSGNVYMVGSATSLDFAEFNQQFTVNNGVPGGYIDSHGNYGRYRVGAGIRINKWNFETNYAYSELSLDGGGVANARAVVDFWPSLLVGNYNYLFSGAVQANQYQLGASYQGSRFSFQSGLQYIHLVPKFDLTYWRGVVFGLGRAGENSEHLTIDQVDMCVLSLGVGYRYGLFAIHYAVAQFIPFSTHSTVPATVGTNPDGGSSKGLFEQIGDKISHHPGGLVQRLLFTVSF